jgi:hypothetical protein
LKLRLPTEAAIEGSLHSDRESSGRDSSGYWTYFFLNPALSLSFAGVHCKVGCLLTGYLCFLSLKELTFTLSPPSSWTFTTAMHNHELENILYIVGLLLTAGSKSEVGFLRYSLFPF